MRRQIVVRDLQCGGLNWQSAPLAVLIIPRLRIVLLDDTVLSFKSLVHF